MSQEAISLVSPPGRLVWGSTKERATQDYDGNAYPDPSKAPFTFGHAVRKDHPQVADFLTKIYGQAVAGYPNNAQLAQRMQNEWQSGFTAGFFRFKIKDGDKPNQDGTTNENTKGCWVFAYQTSLPIKATHYGMNLTNAMGQPIPSNAEIDQNIIERGYYVDINLSCRVNEKLDATAGVYLNPNVVRLVGYGEKIVGGMSTEQAFAGVAAPVGLPVGASATPIGGSTVPSVVVPNPTSSPAATPAVGGLPGAPTAATLTTAIPASVAVNVQPHTAFLPGVPGQ